MSKEKNNATQMQMLNSLLGRQQEPLEVVREAVDALAEIKHENEKIQETIALRQETFGKLTDLSLAAAQLIGAIDSGVPEVETSSLQCLSKLDKSTTIVPNKPEDEADASPQIGSKILNQILVMVAEFSQQPNLNLISSVQFEQKLNKVFEFAEKKSIIPTVKNNESWKALTQSHLLLYQKLNSINEQEDAGETPDAEQ